MIKEEKLKDNEYRIFKLDLAFEDYQDDKQDTSMPLFDEIIHDVNNYRRTKVDCSIDKRIELSDKILNKYNKLLDIVGRENFTFYDDGDINYIWMDGKENE